MRNNMNVQRTIIFLRNKGFEVGIVERFIPIPPHGIRRDLFGFIDMIAMKEGIGIVGVQACSAGTLKEHYRKIMSKDREAVKWLKCGGRIYLFGWRKLKKKRGSKLMIWRPKMAVIRLYNFDTGREPIYLDWEELEEEEF